MNIAIYGAGGFGKEVACLIDRINRNGGNWNLIGFFDDTKPAGSSVSRYGTVLGNMDALMQINHPLAVAIAINDNKVVRRLRELISNPHITFPNLIDPSLFLVDEQTVTTSGSGFAQFTINGITVGTYLSSTQYDIVFRLEDALTARQSGAVRIHEGIPVYAWGKDHFDVYGEFHIHDRDDVMKYSTIYPDGYRWNLIGTASGTTPVTFDSSNYSEIMLVSKYYENANNNWIATAIIPVNELVAEGLVVMMPARIYSSTQNDKGCLVRITTTTANVDEWYSNRTSVRTNATLSVYMR